MILSFENIPAQLKEDASFCVWARRKRDGKTTKVPYNPQTGAKAKPNDPTTFAPFGKAVSALSRRPGEYDGIGVGMFEDLVGIDIDHCVSEDGTLSDMAQTIVDKIGSYTEVSPSGTGLHILCRAPQLAYDKDRYFMKNSALGLEIYPAGLTQRYLTLTGNAILSNDLCERTDEVKELLEAYMLRGAVGTATRKTVSDPQTDTVLDDAILVDKMLNSAAGGSVASLWAGEWEQNYGSQSEADIALCNYLAFWTAKDAEQMDRLFRQSGLMRDKWDRAQSGSSYGAITIQRAIADCTSVWTPGYGQSVPVTRGVEDALAFLKRVDLVQNPRYRRDDIGAGYLLADYLKPFARPLADGKAWFVYDGKRWIEDKEKSTAREAAKDISRALALYAATLPETDIKEYLSWAGKWSDGSKRERFLKESVSVYTVTREAFDKNPWLLNLNNGVLDLKTMSFRGHDPDDMLSMLAPVDYDPAAVFPRWEQFIEEIMVPGDSETTGRESSTVGAEKADYLQRYLGYCLTGDTSAEAFAVMYGPTSRNGKSVCVEAVQAVLGDYAKAMNPESLTLAKFKDGRGPSEDIARLKGVRMASVPEIQQGAKLDASRVKQLTGGDSINARFLGENSFDFIPQCKLLLHTNHLPQCSDLSVFESGRANVIPFSRHFEEWEQDRSLKTEFRKPENQSGILNWMIHGLREYMKRGLTAPEAIRAATAEYRKDSDKLSRFMDDALEQTPDGEVRLSLLYSAYKVWCRENGQYPESSRHFRRGLERTEVQIVRKRPVGGGENTTVVIGYRLFAEYLLDVG